MKLTHKQRLGSLLGLAIQLLTISVAFGRGVKLPNLSRFAAKSDLVFIGQITAVHVREKTYDLTYPMWQGYSFRENVAEVSVMEELKGVKKGESISLLFLTGGDQAINRPHTVSLSPGKSRYLFFLTRDSVYPDENFYWAYTTPDARNSVIDLRKSNSEIRSHRITAEALKGAVQEFASNLVANKPRVSTGTIAEWLSYIDFVEMLEDLVSEDGAIASRALKWLKDLCKQGGDQEQAKKADNRRDSPPSE